MLGFVLNILLGLTFAIPVWADRPILIAQNRISPQEQQRQVNCRTLGISNQALVEPCLRNDPIPDGHSTWSSYAQTLRREETAKQMKFREESRKRRDEASREQQRRLNCSFILVQSVKDRCLNNEAIPDGYMTWFAYEESVIRQQNERRNNERAQEQQRQREAREAEARRQQEAQLERLRKQREIEAEQRKLQEQRRSNPQSVQQPSQQASTTSGSTSGSTALLAITLIIAVFGGGFGAWHLYERVQQRKAANIDFCRIKVLEDWGSLEEFRETLDLLDEQLEMSRVQKWQPEHWETFVTRDVMDNWDAYQKDRNRIFRQFKRYEERGWEAELVVAEIDLHRIRSRVNELMQFFKKQSEIRWRLLTAKEKPNASKPKPISPSSNI